VNNPYYRQYFRLAQIPDPAGLFVFIDEHPDSINDGYFLNRVSTYEWTDLPASFHNQGANLVFADGHAETHRWVNASTLRPARPDGAQLPFAVEEPEDQDWDWLMQRTTTPRVRYSTAAP
jgi:prepilin-type processing-associated H-X9-DG protein